MTLQSAVERALRGKLDPMAERGCTRKVKYVTEDEARRHAKLMHKRHNGRFEAYACRYCGGFHVGHGR